MTHTVTIEITYDGEYSDIVKMLDNAKVKTASYDLVDAIARAKPIDSAFCRVRLAHPDQNRILAEVARS